MKCASFLSLLCLFVAVWMGQAAEPKIPRQPEPNPPAITNPAAKPATVGLAAGPVLYSIGQPTDDEQLYLELINRARANPPQEGVWFSQLTDPDVLSAIDFFDVNMTLMVNEFAAIAPAQPLAFNGALIAAARLHSALMFTNMVQEHQITSINEPGLTQRLTNAGYTPAAASENIFSYSENTVFGHAGFQIDWGSDADGMQAGRGHRVNIHRADFRELGVGVYDGVNGDVGPQLVTQDFARTSANTPFLTGVVYHDLNSNQFYDLGEGLGGVTVEVTGVNFYAITAGSGGYTIPLPGNGSYTVTFTAANGGSFTTNVTVSGNLNVKVDWHPAYQTPALTGPAKPVNGYNMSYHFTTPIGITSYSWQVTALTPLTFSDTADGGLGNFTVTTSVGYSVTGADTTVTRSSVFHLAQPQAVTQTMKLNTTFIPRAGASLSFASRVAKASNIQVPRVQYSQDNGVTWTDLWSVTGGAEQTVYQTINLDLGTLSRVDTQIRFVFDLLPQAGTFFNGIGYNSGWCFDSISLTGVDTGSIAGSSTVNNASQFQFTTSAAGNYLVSLKASVAGRNYPSNGFIEVQSVAAPAVTISSLQNSPAKKFDVGFSHAASGTVKVFTANSITGPWTEETGTSLQTLTAEQNFRVILPTFSNNRFYRVQLAPQ